MRSQTPVRVGIIGGGLMGKEVAAAIDRWAALDDHPVRPVLTAVCDIDPGALSWFEKVPTVKTRTGDYHDLLDDPDIDVLYIAVRHDLHQEFYVDAIRAGKDVLAEKPFGIDLAAAERIVAELDANPRVFMRCSSEMPFFPGAQAAVRLVQSGFLGKPIEAVSGFSHSSDLDPEKPISWKRQRRYCGDAGVMNDLGMHVAHVPLRLGWDLDRVYAVLQNLVPQRIGPDGAMMPCDTWENATLIADAAEAGRAFPLRLEMKRADPGQKNSWTFRALGMDGGVEFSTRHPKTLRVFGHASLPFGQGGTEVTEQVWHEVELGSQSVFPTVTGPIFEFGFSDAILQMWAAFLAEREGELGDRFGCVTPAEAVASHRIWEAAMKSAATGRPVSP